jgi:HKD family nuclease
VDIVFLDNRGRSVGSAIEEAMATATHVSLAVAYSSQGGVAELEGGVRDVATRGGRTRLLSGLDDFVTELEGVDRLSRLPGTECRVFLPHGPGGAGRFHPKLYVFRGPREASVIVGSSNLTAHGLKANYEACVWLRGEPEDPELAAMGESFEALWRSPRAVALDEGIRRQYESARRARESALANVVGLAEYRRWTAALGSRVARALARPESRRWLMVTSPTNFEICVQLGRWGDERWGRIAQVRAGDGIVFYVTGEHSLGGVAVAVGPARPSQDRPWPDRPYPYQMDVQFLWVASRRPSIRPLIGHLDLFDRSERNWGQRLQTTLRQLSPRDFEILSRAAGWAPAAPLHPTPEAEGSEGRSERPAEPA